MLPIGPGVVPCQCTALIRVPDSKRFELRLAGTARQERGAGASRQASDGGREEKRMGWALARRGRTGSGGDSAAARPLSAFPRIAGGHERQP